MIGAVGELDCFNAHIRFREPDKSKDKAECGTSVESSIPCSHRGRSLVVKGGQGGGEFNGKLQVPRLGGRVEAKKLHKTDVDGLFIKIAESEGLRVDAGVLDQGMK
ncbi:hypothetical protein B296_00008087 [Ensete ventricosum]|uniref:Uncharacterized protein n=1 Tax=Ensete ventricosum TaxID=4639 RepID=A0A427AJM3_ENSVE|nr:hypothetical protein B296_00008087 [Ensete ventricosum]